VQYAEQYTEQIDEADNGGNKDQTSFVYGMLHFVRFNYDKREWAFGTILADAQIC
jgi:hypothetical protein